MINADWCQQQIARYQIKGPLATDASARLAQSVAAIVLKKLTADKLAKLARKAISEALEAIG